MSKVVNKDGKWVVVDDAGGILSTPFTERSAAEKFMNLREAVIPSADVGARPEELSRARSRARDLPQQYGPAPATAYHGPPAPLVPASQRPWRAADANESAAYQVGVNIRTGQSDLRPGWMSKVNLSTEQWRALLAGLGVQNMPSTPNPKHPEEY